MNEIKSTISIILGVVSTLFYAFWHLGRSEFDLQDQVSTQMAVGGMLPAFMIAVILGLVVAVIARIFTKNKNLLWIIFTITYASTLFLTYFGTK